MSNTLVAYFSASGVTAKVAKRMAEVLESDLFEIQPKIPYTAAELDWQDKNSRSSVEMADKASRPAIATRVEDMSKYDVIYVAFPKMEYGFRCVYSTQCL